MLISRKRKQDLSLIINLKNDIDIIGKLVTPSSGQDRCKTKFFLSPSQKSFNPKVENYSFTKEVW